MRPTRARTGGGRHQADERVAGLSRRLRAVVAERTLSEVAARTGYAAQTVRGYMSGDQLPASMFLARLAWDFDLSIDELCFGSQRERDTGAGPGRGLDADAGAEISLALRELLIGRECGEDGARTDERFVLRLVGTGPYSFKAVEQDGTE